MPRPLRNRFIHLELEPDFEDWSRWAVKAAIRPEILAFLRFKPALLHNADATSDQNAWPTPRSWEMASSVLAGVAQRQGSSGFAAGTEIEAALLEGFRSLQEGQAVRFDVVKGPKSWQAEKVEVV
jgi:hypothetical protein